MTVVLPEETHSYTRPRWQAPRLNLEINVEIEPDATSHVPQRNLENVFQNEFGGFSTLERKVLLQSTLKVLIIGDLPLVISSLADYSLVKRINYLDGKFDWNIGLYWNMDRIVEIKDVFNSASRSKMMMYRQPPPLNYLV